MLMLSNVAARTTHHTLKISYVLGEVCLERGVKAGTARRGDSSKVSRKSGCLTDVEDRNVGRRRTVGELGVRLDVKVNPSACRSEGGTFSTTAGLVAPGSKRHCAP
mmetsp:Transcript_36099/g.78003  ORF Transcript_36099/g.78003 Transcript_36099/m.78003 type:complete len:106 (-) Transcript_36099:21-338(-)